MVHKPGRELSVTAAHPILILSKLRFHFDVFEEFDVGLVQRGPMAVSCTQAHVKQLAQIVAETGEESQVLQLPRLGWDLDNARVWRRVSEEHLFKPLKHLQIDSIFQSGTTIYVWVTTNASIKMLVVNVPTYL
jgi:hypothetical protein